MVPRYSVARTHAPSNTCRNLDPRRRLEAGRLHKDYLMDALGDLIKALRLFLRVIAMICQAVPLSKITRDETGMARNKMNIGYTKLDDGTFVKASCVALLYLTRDGLNSIGPFSNIRLSRWLHVFSPGYDIRMFNSRVHSLVKNELPRLQPTQITRPCLWTHWCE